MEEYADARMYVFRCDNHKCLARETTIILKTPPFEYTDAYNRFVDYVALAQTKQQRIQSPIILEQEIQ
jgi:hypothetical protein